MKEQSFINPDSLLIEKPKQRTREELPVEDEDSMNASMVDDSHKIRSMFRRVDLINKLTQHIKSEFKLTEQIYDKNNESDVLKRQQENNDLNGFSDLNKLE